MTDITRRASPNHDARPPGGPVDILLVHYTGMESAEAALDRLCDPAAKVSAHYLIDEAGRIFALVDEARRAWHAGVASWAGAADINARSVGIELVNPGHEFGYRPFPEAQMRALDGLAIAIVARHGIPPHRVIGHSDVAPERKQDPGELFDWARLARLGLGLWPAPDFAPSPHAEALGPGASGAAVVDLQLALGGLGYRVEGTGLYDTPTGAVVTAFQRHWRQSGVDGIADGETRSLIHHLLDRLPDGPA
ncbi:N-acetylmuramoyl-L-alanine amidase [Oceanibacterium hippocampi]|uniref:N-acetylmuramoyl-L-alanine amidase n=1 Tax=Oceanibacterium hippocampi TaxID=745714 RepID=A0A1Y5SC07_9PROT|nr:N-acetylmuramoyl-L-alanine amidase [Oceanibacterium hippocampi]SLN37171.1 N-acetylmuramoyl-L-alanine amidase AmiD precursor [Oceanibacterium hippocampi]